ncbi:MAG: response regulator [Ignavibacteria bacterium]|nr:response regulator [Ignavibacteria bacterium]
MRVDLTERKRAEEATLAAKVRAENSEKLKDVFIANISHEIRTPLNIILGFTNVIEEMYLPAASVADHHIFESVERGGERLMRTVDMILNVSRLQSGEFPLKLVDVNIPQLVRGVVADMQPIARQRNLSLTTVDECGSVTVVADEYCIVQAVSNLVNNAIKFTAHGGVEIRIFRDAQQRVCLSCHDTGIGISKEYLPVLFTRYSQEQSGYTRPFDGLGLGTALIQEYLIINNATIAVESEKGVGSTFTITFQKNGKTHARPAIATASAPRAAPEALPDRTPRHQGKRSVLLVEDDRMTIDFMKLVLAPHWDVSSARSGPEAWDILRAVPVDIILMDISLAGSQTGVELTREIRSSPEHCALPIIAVTAHAYDSDRSNCLAAGCDDFLRKPVNTDALASTMERLLAR